MVATTPPPAGAVFDHQSESVSVNCWVVPSV
jgi:hypothetical protein